MLRTFYFIAFAAVGISTPYLAPYLGDLGLSGGQIATVLSMVPLANLGVPLAWAWIADRTQRHDRVLRVTCLGSACGLILLLTADHFRTALGAYAVVALFNVGVTPLADTLAVGASRDGTGYGRVRVWGSLGFLVSAVCGGALLTARGGRAADPLVPGLMAASLLSASIVAFGIRGAGAPTAPRPHVAELRGLFADRRFRLLLIVGPLHWIGLAPYNVFFGLFIRQRHLPPAVGGAAFALGVIAEGAVLFGFTSLRRHYRLQSLLIISFGTTVVRWLLVWRAHAAAWVVALQVLHGLTFGLFWIASIALLNECVPRPLRATGQAIYMMAMLGVGSLIGYQVTGRILDAGNDIGVAFLGAGLTELVPLVLAIRAARARPAAAAAIVGPS